MMEARWAGPWLAEAQCGGTEHHLGRRGTPVSTRAHRLEHLLPRVSSNAAADYVCYMSDDPG